VPRLIVNADDFGLTSGVNRAIVELHRAGVLTSATLMARAPATDEAIELARSTPSLGIGCHVVLVDGQPILPPRAIPSLVDPGTGSFLPTLRDFVIRLFTGRIRATEIQAEASAQIKHLQSSGVSLTHVDTHKHTHMFPAVLRPVLRAARAARIRAVRNPFEPAWAVRATAGAALARVAEVTVLRFEQPFFRKILAEEQFASTDGTIAVAGTGILNSDALCSLLGKLPPGTFELVTHPGYNDAALLRVRTRLRESREIERTALIAIREFPFIDLVSYAALPQPELPRIDL
jgi:hopanoid biosynthesis associated protein HpnK